MVENDIMAVESDAVGVGAAHLVGELGEPRTEREARLLVSVAITAAAAMVARQVALSGADQTSVGALARRWGDEFAQLIEQTVAALPER